MPAPHPAYAPAARPGPVPLQPLTLSDIFNGSFGVVTRNRAATLGVAVLVALAAALIPMVAAIVVGSTTAEPIIYGNPLAPIDPARMPDTGFGMSSGDIGYLISLLLASWFATTAASLLHGVVAAITGRSVLGETVRLDQVWPMARPLIARLIGLIAVGVMIGLGMLVVAGLVPWAIWAATENIGLTFGVGALAWLLVVLAMIYVNVRYLMLAPAVLALEKRSVFGSMRRAGALVGPATAGPFWRIFGIMLLLSLITAIAANLVGMPVSLLGLAAQSLIEGDLGRVLGMMLQQFGSILATMLLAPVMGAAYALLYLDQRFRREGFHVQLLANLQSRLDTPS